MLEATIERLKKLEDSTIDAEFSIHQPVGEVENFNVIYSDQVQLGYTGDVFIKFNCHIFDEELIKR